MGLQASELRIGNWVNVVGTGSVQVSELTRDEHLSELLPIELTEEWLLRFGFHKDGFDIFQKVTGRKTFRIQLKHGNDIIYENDIGMGFFSLGVDLNYTHQLQNLYFPLTSEEL